MNDHSSQNSQQTSNSSRDLSCQGNRDTDTPTDSNVGKHCLRQARYWIGTIPRSDWSPKLPPGAQYCRGQLERGEGGFEHWQILVTFSQKKTLAQVVRSLGTTRCHVEPTRSRAAEQYVWKLESRIGEYL